MPAELFAIVITDGGTDTVLLYDTVIGHSQASVFDCWHFKLADKLAKRFGFHAAIMPHEVWLNCWERGSSGMESEQTTHDRWRQRKAGRY